MSIELLDESESGIDLDLDHFQALARFVMDTLRVHPQAELNVNFVDEPTIQQLKKQWMGYDEVTDVLSWPMDELRPGMVGEDPEEGILGDIALSPTVAARQGEATGHGTQAEIELLITHGILHLLGYDHVEADEHTEMFALQAKLLADFGSAAVAPR